MTESNKESKNTFLDQVSDTVLDGLKPRISDPFLGVYMISFIIWNFQIILYIFSSVPPQEKYDKIVSSFNYWSFIVPLIWVALINFAFPKLLLKLYKKSEAWKVHLSSELNTIRSEHVTMRVIKAQLMDQIESLQSENGKHIMAINELRHENSQIKSDSVDKYEIEKQLISKKYSERIAELEKNYESSSKRLSEAHKEIERTNSTNTELTNRLHTTQNQLDLFSNTNENNSSLTKQHSIDQLKALNDFLQNRNLIDNFKDINFRLLIHGGNLRLDDDYLSKSSLPIFITKKIIETFNLHEGFGNDYLRMTKLGEELYSYIIDTESE